MYSKKDKYNLAYIFIYLLIAAVGLNNSLGITKGEFAPPIFYTSVSGLICFIYFLIGFIRAIYFIALKEDFSTKMFIVPRAKGAVTICITITLLLYHFLVYEGPVLSVDTDIYNLITHYIVPFMVIFHWIIFDKKGIYERFDPFLWTIIPIGYFSWANIVALNHKVVPYFDGDFYPYSFMDLNIHSVQSVMLTVVLIFIAFVTIGYVVYYFDYTLGSND